MAYSAALRDSQTGFVALSHRIILSDGWARRGVTFLSGAIGALALAPFDFAPAMAVPLTVSVWLIDGSAAKGDGLSTASLRAAAGAGWWLGFGYFVAGLWWLGAAMLVEADQFAWALPLAVLGLPAVLAIFTAAGFAASRVLWSNGALRVFALAAGLGGSEWLRGHVLTGFPWNDVGMALAAAGPLAQTASLVGLHGLDLLAILIFAAPATLADRAAARRKSFGVVLATAMALLVVMTGYGVLRLMSGPTTFVVGVKLRLMQPNLPQDAKFRPENGPKILEHYLALSARPTDAGRNGGDDITHLIWPESAFPYVLMQEPEALGQIAQALKGAVLITGAARVEEVEGSRRGRIYNAIEVLQGDQLLAFYDKIHLVPFGEYLPLARLLKPLGVHHLVPGVWDRGEGPRELSAPGLPPIAPLICFEAAFPGKAAPRLPGVARAQLLLNVTNDGWFGQTTGPYQHFAQARLRAIEEGLPLVRVANTGVSAVVDAYGRILAALPLGEEGVIDARLPQAAPESFFARHSSGVFPVLWGIVLLIAAIGRWRG